MRVELLRSWAFVGHAIDLDLAIDHHARYNAGPRRRMLAEEFFENFVEGREVAWIVEPDTAAHDVLRPIARFVQDREEIANRLLGLHKNVSLDNFAIDHRHLAGHI